nr:MAG TPA: hypothetical protein [Caudoviricetes sp.]
MNVSTALLFFSSEFTSVSPPLVSYAFSSLQR